MSSIKNRTEAATPSIPATPLDPQAGGRYERNADGTLTVLHQTESAGGRAQRAQRAQEEAAAAQAGASGNTQTPQE